MSALGVEKYRDKHETALLLIDLKNKNKTLFGI